MSRVADQVAAIVIALAIAYLGAHVAVALASSPIEILAAAFLTIATAGIAWSLVWPSPRR